MDKWQSWEQEVARTLQLDTTISSGNRFHDTGDAVTRGRDKPFPLWADAKWTEKKSFSLKLKDLSDYTTRAFEQCKTMIMPIRFWSRERQRSADFVVLSFHDFVELYEKAISNGISS